VASQDVGSGAGGAGVGGMRGGAVEQVDTGDGCGGAGGRGSRDECVLCPIWQSCAVPPLRSGPILPLTSWDEIRPN
jgi:hypothetical protein